jgi:galactoside O-acetyltransferase
VCGKVELGKHVILGSGVTILPNVTIGEGSAVGSMSLVNKLLEPWGIYAGVPCRYKKRGQKSCLN